MDNKNNNIIYENIRYIFLVSFIFLSFFVGILYLSPIENQGTIKLNILYLAIGLLLSIIFHCINMLTFPRQKISTRRVIESQISRKKRNSKTKRDKKKEDSYSPVYSFLEKILPTQNP